MTTLQEEQFIKKYGEVLVKFIYYYKYSFSFVGECEGKDIRVTVGGSGEDIYRLDVEAGKEYKIKDLGVTSACIKEKEILIEDYYSGW